MRMYLQDLLFKTRLKRARSYKYYWACATCGTPRRLGSCHHYKKCGKCGSQISARIVIQEKERRGEKHSLRRAAACRVLVGTAKTIAEDLRLGKPKAVLEQVTRPRHRRDFGDDFFTQYFNNGLILRGLLPYDVCLQYVPMEVRKKMAKTKMMQLRIPEDLHKWFKRYSQDREVPMTLIVIAYLERLRARHKKNFEPDQI